MNMTVKAINDKKAWKDNLLNCHHTVTVDFGYGDEVIALCPTKKSQNLTKIAFEIMFCEIRKAEEREKTQ